MDVLIRPNDLVQADNSPNALEITEKVFRGSDYIYTLKLPSGLEVSCIAPSHLNRDLGTPLGVALKTDQLVVFKRDTG